ncbi:MAG: hypothetical protein EOR34_30325 [Mesorhizobium sp.]|uniref:hypothetical protein n=1 Tax=unclassified Mesorhizobium TaxID=325217 RepID=UPI000FE79647|nr:MULTISPECIES: hypothetical protein [unclassified Mesorhizobium]RWF86054.1 MAG: hypothetical protein EOQ36_19635 [Mesorhizobium sp.]RWI34680.1 MAG: hypothetical protein EOR14_30050 [Mesorhizobium sp.]RWI64018.1 MAG: hypothetical protein EOR17_27205 [Mesorhizobium sp.]RWJ57687.1 MAG: hypothetical protein EOR32_28810 [Mesorhizobium sp.]RWJ65328.1 MAG: hypothetical protein EOR34_30325 [Mesorhizobium sp.]
MEKVGFRFHSLYHNSLKYFNNFDPLSDGKQHSSACAFARSAGEADAIEKPAPPAEDAGCDRREDPIWQHLSAAAEAELSSLACVPRGKQKTAAQGSVK